MKKEKIWIFTFEYSGIAKVGGLGEVPPNQAKFLAKEYDTTVFIPSHGQIERLKRTIKCEKLPLHCEGTIIIGMNYRESRYNISYYKCEIDGVNVILLSGDNDYTSRYLDDDIVYNPDTFSWKMCLFSIGMQYYVEHLIDRQRDDLPSIIHMHDYHVVISYLGIKQVLKKNDLDVASLLTIHLLTWPKYDLSYYKMCGIDDTPIRIVLNDGLKLLTINEIFTLCGGSPTIEKIGAVVSDLVTTVSNSYLNSDIIPNLGQDLIRFKSDFIWDGCDWDHDEIYQNVLNNHADEIRKFLNLQSTSEIGKSDMKKYLLTYKIGNLNKRPSIKSRKVLELIDEISDGNIFISNGKIKAFNDTGPLIISSGRMSKMKGFDVIFEAIPIIIKVIPEAKFLLQILPSDYNNDIKYYADVVKKYPHNLRIIFGKTLETFHLAYISANVYCALSRWEPFGIVALEAMSMKLPVIATRVGGLQESVIDLRKDPINGTGILIEKDNPDQFASALISLLKLAKISEIGSTYDTESLKLINQIPDDILKSRAILDANYYNKIKENSISRVQNNFKWNIVSKKVIEIYEKIKNPINS